MDPDMKIVLSIVLVVVLVLGSSITGCMMYWPQYNIYAQKMAGEAEFQRAESNRQIKVREAQAALDSASLTARAEIERAKGVAEANAIIAGSLGGPEGYLRWRYIEMLENTGATGRDVIYVPTEAGLPILEAGKRPITVGQ